THQECAEEKRLVPGAALADPSHRIGPGVEYIVEMNQHARPEAGEDSEQEEYNVTAYFGDMAGVDEEDVLRLELIKDGERHFLHPLREDRDGGRIVRSDQGLEQSRIGFNERERRPHGAS